MKKKILIAQNSLGGGGAEKVLIDILNNFDYEKYEVDLFLLNRTGVYLNKVNKNVKVISVINIDKIGNKFLKKVFNKIGFLMVNYFTAYVHRRYIGNKYDVEIAFLEGLTTKFISTSKNNNSKKISWVHIDLNKYRLLSKEEEKSVYESFDKIICVSNDSKKSIDNLYPTIKGKSKVLYNLIDTEHIIEKSLESVVKNDNLPTVIAIGRLTNQKRFDILIRAHKKLLEEGIEHKLLILGEGELEDNLKNLINELSVGDTVKLEGFKENPYPYIRESHCVAMSSDYEGLPLVICESLVLGKAIVATNCTGPKELLDNGKFGMLVNCGDIEELKNGLKIILINNGEKEKLEKLALERSLIFDKKKVMNEIYTVLK